MHGDPVNDVGPDPGSVATLADLAREVDLLRCRAARGSRKARVSLSDLADRVDVPRSTLHTYVAGRTLAPIEVLDRIVIALGAAPAEQAQWSEAWFRVAEHLHEQRVSSPDAVDAVRFVRLLDRSDRCDSPAAEDALLREALMLWRGAPPLSGWLPQSERPALVERRLAAMERLADMQIASGRSGEIVADLRDLTQHHPLRESLWARLLVALDGAGRAAEALAAYETVRSQLARELGVDPGAELQRMYADLVAGTALIGEPADRLVVPRQLPADIDDFTGRDQDLRTLGELLERDPATGATLVAVHGAGGIGKTALAVHWANRVREWFTGGQLFVNLRGYGPGEPLEPPAALDALLRGLGTPGERIPDSVEARSALLRTTLAGRRVLVVLDNARDAAHVRPLLPGAGTVVIVTSRSQLRGLAVRENAHRISLDVLPADDARRLLAERLKGQSVAFEDDSLAALAELCGYLPLALTVAAERAGRHPDSPLAELIRQLHDERERLDLLETGEDLTTSLRAVMSWSYQALDPEAARLFRLLGLHPGADIGTPATATLAGVSRPVACRLLDRLVETHLLRSPRLGRYAMHDLVRMYAGERSAADDPPAERDEAVRRLCRWYARSAGNAHSAISTIQLGDSWPPDDSIEPLVFDDGQQAMAWFGVEQHTLLAVIAEAVQTGLHREVYRLVRAVSRYFSLTRVPGELTALHELALSSARAAGDQHAEAQLHNQLGVIHLRLGKFEVARRCFESGHTLFHQLDDPFGEFTALGNIGLTHWHLDHHAEAIDCLERAIEHARRHDLGDASASALNNLAMVYNDIGRHAEAETAAVEAIRLRRDAGQRLEEAIAIDTLGGILLARGDNTTAESHFAQALHIHRELGSQWHLACTLRNLGQAQHAAGDIAAARTSWQDALRTLDVTGAADTSELSRAELHDHLAQLR